MWELAREFSQLLGAWWGHDRIRCSPLDGRLLQLPPDSILMIEGEWAMIRRRIVRQSPQSFLLYECETKAGPATLRLDPALGNAGQVVWETESERTTIDQSEIEIFPAPQQPASTSTV